MKPCPQCGEPAALARVSTRVKRGVRVLAVTLEAWQCGSGCMLRDGARPFSFSNQALARRNDASVAAAWFAAFGEELPGRGVPGRKSDEPRVRTIHVKLSEAELRELDTLRGAMTRSEFVRCRALTGTRRGA